MNLKHSGRSAATGAPGAAYHVKWTSGMEYAGPYPETYKRFFKLETLTNAFEKALKEKDRFIHAGLKAVSDDISLSSLSCDLAYEDSLRYLFLLTIVNKARKKISARFVVAKNHEECSAALEKECLSLEELHPRNPGHVISPARRGVLYLPDRHKRKDVSRELFAYYYRSPVNLAPLYVASPRQLAPHGTRPLCFSLKETDRIKQDIIGIIASCYDEHSQSGLDPRDLYPECFSVQGPAGKGTPVVMLTQCPRVQKKLRSGQLIQRLLYGTFKSSRHVFPLAPERPEGFFEALTRVLPPGMAETWCNAFFSRQKAHPGVLNEEDDALLPGRDYLGVLREVVNG